MWYCVFQSWVSANCDRNGTISKQCEFDYVSTGNPALAQLTADEAATNTELFIETSKQNLNITIFSKVKTLCFCITKMHRYH